MTDTVTHQHTLPLGSMLMEYRIERILGAGGFGITYLAFDTHLEKRVAIKEYLPTSIASRAPDGSVVPLTAEQQHDYQWGLDRFLHEARTLAKFSHPYIVRVNRFFKAHSTAYMVMGYEDGESLKSLLARVRTLDEAKLRAILSPLLDGLAQVHAVGFLHRDIKPDNIFIRTDGSPVLIDFGAARQAVGGATQSLTAIVSPGFAPFEQYSAESHQGPWSDIYAMSAVLCQAVTGDKPPDAVSRMKFDTIVSVLAAARSRYSANFIQAIEWGFQLDEKKRPQSIGEWKRLLLGLPSAVSSGGVPLRKRAGERTAVTGSGAATGMRPSEGLRPLAAPRPVELGPRRSSKWVWLLAAGLSVLVLGTMFGMHRKPGADHLAPAALAATRAGPEDLNAEPRKEDLPRPVQSRDRSHATSGETALEGAASQRLSSAEHWERVETRFAKMDTAGTGALDLQQMERAFPRLATRFGEIDTNHDGRVTLAEIKAFWHREALAKKQARESD